MDGVGECDSGFGNAVKMAQTPNMKYLKENGIYRPIYAHGTYVGLPSNSDIGNSEVGHNALGAGTVYDQGAKLVSNAIESESIFAGDTWKEIVSSVMNQGSTLHFLGLLSDGNVHSHEQHLYKMMKKAVSDGVKKIRVHALIDGRDVGEKSAETYVQRLEEVIGELNATGADVKVASGGGRMSLTMDRYEADWSMVERGWKHHVLGEGEKFASLSDAIAHFRKDSDLIDQYLPGFVIGDESGPNGTVEDGDAVIFFNFRGDRSIEISLAFTEEDFDKFDRVRFPKVKYAGMMEYDGDLHIPNNYLVTPPSIKNTLGETLVTRGIKQFACSETQKFGHVTYFWNGNKTGYFDKSLEEYLEIPSDVIEFDEKPWMKAYEITEETTKRIKEGSFAVIAVEVVDQMLGKLIKACKETGTILLVTADHGNCDQMFDAKEEKYPNWQELSLDARPSPKTSHTLSQVPLYVFDPKGSKGLSFNDDSKAGLANIANTALDLMGVEKVTNYEDSLIIKA
jgi:2,3-bisphosphoglycerate-independent phosphoglycerate mutase